MQYTYWDIFSTAQNSFWTRWFWRLSVLLPFFVQPLPHQPKCVPLRTFSSGKQTKKLLRPRSGEYGRWGIGVMPFLVKSCWTLSAVWADDLINHSSKNGQTHWKSLQKNFTEVEHTTTSRFANTDGFLEHSPSGGSLYYKGLTLHKIIPFLFRTPPPPVSLNFSICKW